MTNNESTFAIDDEFGSRIADGLTYEGCVSQARTYLSAHKDAPCVEIYDTSLDEDGETFKLTREQVLENR